MSAHDQLENALRKIRFPHGIVACPGKYCAITGESFFPGGRGHTGSDLPSGGVMYLGHNFDKVDGFKASVQRGHEENLTWRKIRAGILPHVPASQIWFTNYFMGVQTGTSNIGRLERTTFFDAFEEDCWNLFKLQVSLQKPRAIVALGKEVVRALAAPNRLNIPSWTIKENTPYGSLRLTPHKIRLKLEGEHHDTILIAAYHPSFGRDDKKLALITEDAKFVASLLQS
jgi:hypothetical protein